MALDANVSQGVPDKRVVVKDGSTVSHDDQAYRAGDELVLPGPTAIAMELNNYVTILGDVV